MGLRASFVVCGLICCCGCLPEPKTISNTQAANAGVNIVPEAVLASQKFPPSDRPTSLNLPDLIDTISNSDQKHYTMIELLRTSGLVPTLQEAGPYTVLAPTDEAFNKLPPGVVDRLMLPGHHAQLVQFVKYHLLAGKIDQALLVQTNGLIPTLNGKAVVVRGIGDKATVNDANVLRSDTSASNGTIHWLDSVLLPPV